MSASPQAPGPGPEANTGEPRASGVLVAVVVALLAVVAVVAIVSGGGTTASGTSINAEERAIERAAAANARTTAGGRVEGTRHIVDAGARRAPEAGVAALETPAFEPGASAVVLPSPPSAAPPTSAAAPREVSLDQEYEATAFFLDMLVLRRDTVRRDLEEARRVGDGPRIRRLEPDQATLDGEIARFVARSHELEGRMRAREEANEPPSDEPDPPEGL